MYYNIIEYTIYLNAENWIITVKGPDDFGCGKFIFKTHFFCIVSFSYWIACKIE
jgi:hypothetical protein